MSPHSGDARNPRRSLGRGRRHPSPDMSAGQVREWLSSYVYGNITVLSAAIAVTPQQIHHGAAVWTVLATGLLTFLAHVLAHVVAHGFGQTANEQEPAVHRAALREVLSTARPIATSALIPAALFAAAWLGWLPSAWGQAAAVIVLAVRIGFVGYFMQRFSGKALTLRALWSGLVLALVAFGIGIAKVLLTH